MKKFVANSSTVGPKVEKHDKTAVPAVVFAWMCAYMLIFGTCTQAG